MAHLENGAHSRTLKRRGRQRNEVEKDAYSQSVSVRERASEVSELEDDTFPRSGLFSERDSQIKDLEYDTFLPSSSTGRGGSETQKPDMYSGSSSLKRQLRETKEDTHSSPPPLRRKGRKRHKRASATNAKSASVKGEGLELHTDREVTHLQSPSFRKQTRARETCGDISEDSDATLPYPCDEHNSRTRLRRRTRRAENAPRNDTKPQQLLPALTRTNPVRNRYSTRLKRASLTHHAASPFNNPQPSNRDNPNPQKRSTSPFCSNHTAEVDKPKTRKRTQHRHPLFQKQNRTVARSPKAQSDASQAQSQQTHATFTPVSTAEAPTAPTLPRLVVCLRKAQPLASADNEVQSLFIVPKMTPETDSNSSSPLEGFPKGLDFNLVKTPSAASSQDRIKDLHEEFAFDVGREMRTTKSTSSPPGSTGFTNKGVKNSTKKTADKVPDLTLTTSEVKVMADGKRPRAGRRRGRRRGGRKTVEGGRGRVGRREMGADTAKDEESESDELPTIVPPKRRRPPSSRRLTTSTSAPTASVPRAMQDSVMEGQGTERIMREFPRHNWLEHKILQKNTYTPSPPPVSMSLPTPPLVAHSSTPPPRPPPPPPLLTHSPDSTSTPLLAHSSSSSAPSLVASSFTAVSAPPLLSHSSLGSTLIPPPRTYSSDTSDLIPPPLSQSSGVSCIGIAVDGMDLSATTSSPQGNNRPRASGRASVAKNGTTALAGFRRLADNSPPPLTSSVTGSDVSSLPSSHVRCPPADISHPFSAFDVSGLSSAHVIPTKPPQLRSHGETVSDFVPVQMGRAFSIEGLSTCNVSESGLASREGPGCVSHRQTSQRLSHFLSVDEHVSTKPGSKDSKDSEPRGFNTRGTELSNSNTREPEHSRPNTRESEPNRSSARDLQSGKPSAKELETNRPKSNDDGDTVVDLSRKVFWRSRSKMEVTPHDTDITSPDGDSSRMDQGQIPAMRGAHNAGRSSTPLPSNLRQPRPLQQGTSSVQYPSLSNVSFAAAQNPDTSTCGRGMSASLTSCTFQPSMSSLELSTRRQTSGVPEVLSHPRNAGSSVDMTVDTVCKDVRDASSVQEHRAVHFSTSSTCSKTAEDTTTENDTTTSRDNQKTSTTAPQHPCPPKATRVAQDGKSSSQKASVDDLGMLKLRRRDSPSLPRCRSSEALSVDWWSGGRRERGEMETEDGGSAVDKEKCGQQRGVAEDSGDDKKKTVSPKPTMTMTTTPTTTTTTDLSSDNISTSTTALSTPTTPPEGSHNLPSPTESSGPPAMPSLIPLRFTPQLSPLSLAARRRPPLGPPPSLIPTHSALSLHLDVAYEDPMAVGRRVEEEEEGGGPLDLCTKKTDILGGIRNRGKPPVQLVLPQVQPRSSAVTTTTTTTTTLANDVITSTKRTLRAFADTLALTSSTTECDVMAASEENVSTRGEDTTEREGGRGRGSIPSSTPTPTPTLVPAGAPVSSALGGRRFGSFWPGCRRPGEHSPTQDLTQGREVKATPMKTGTSGGGVGKKEEGEKEQEEEESLRKQLKELEEMAARKEQERAQLLRMCKRKSDMLKEMEVKRRRLNTTSTCSILSTTTNVIQSSTTTTTTISTTTKHNDSSGTHPASETGTSSECQTSSSVGQASGQPQHGQLAAFQRVMLSALSSLPLAGGEDIASSLMTSQTDNLTTSSGLMESQDGGSSGKSPTVVSDLGSIPAEQGPIMQMISQVLQKVAQSSQQIQKARKSGSSGDGIKWDKGGVIRCAHQAEKDDCGSLMETQPSNGQSFSPYTWRQTPLNEPPAPRNAHALNGTPKSAHCQPPFQPAGSLIVPALPAVPAAPAVPENVEQAGPKSQVQVGEHVASAKQTKTCGGEMSQDKQQGMSNTKSMVVHKSGPVSSTSSVIDLTTEHMDRSRLKRVEGSSNLPVPRADGGPVPALRTQRDITLASRANGGPQTTGGLPASRPEEGTRKTEEDMETWVQTELSAAVAKVHKQPRSGVLLRAPQGVPLHRPSVHSFLDYSSRDGSGFLQHGVTSTSSTFSSQVPQLNQPSRAAVFHVFQQQHQGMVGAGSKLASSTERGKAGMPSLRSVRMPGLHSFQYGEQRMSPQEASRSAMMNGSEAPPPALAAHRVPVSTMMARENRAMEGVPSRHVHMLAQPHLVEEPAVVVRNPMEEPPAPRQVNRMVPIAPKPQDNVAISFMQQQQQQQQQHHLQRRAASADNPHHQQDMAVSGGQPPQFSFLFPQPPPPQQQQQQQQQPMPHLSQVYPQQFHPQQQSPVSMVSHSSGNSEKHKVPSHVPSLHPGLTPGGAHPGGGYSGIVQYKMIGMGGGGGSSSLSSSYYRPAGRHGDVGAQMSGSGVMLPAERLREPDMEHVIRMSQMQAAGGGGGGTMGPQPPYLPHATTPTSESSSGHHPRSGVVPGQPYPPGSQAMMHAFPYPSQFQPAPTTTSQASPHHPPTVSRHRMMGGGKPAQHPSPVLRPQPHPQPLSQTSPVQQQLRHHRQQHQQAGMRKPEGVCEKCGAKAMYLCSTCRCVWYCSQQCQTAHWASHCNKCKSKS